MRIGTTIQRNRKSDGKTHLVNTWRKIYRISMGAEDYQYKTLNYQMVDWHFGKEEYEQARRDIRTFFRQERRELAELMS